MEAVCDVARVHSQRHIGLWKRFLGEPNRDTANMDGLTSVDDASDMCLLCLRLRGIVEHMQEHPQKVEFWESKYSSLDLTGAFQIKHSKNS